MGIYRTLLEEEITHLDDNKDSAGQIDELVSDIEDQVVNSDEVQEAKDAEFGTEYGPDAPVNEMYEAIAESDRAWNEMVHRIGLNELSAMVSGRTALYESFEDIKNWFRNIKDKIVAFFKKVWQVIQRWASNLVAMITPGKKFAEKYGPQIRTGAGLYEKADKQLKGFPFSGLDNMRSILAAVSTSYTKESTDIEGLIKDMDSAETLDKTKKEIAEGIFGTDDSGEYRSKLLELIRGADEPETLDNGKQPSAEEIINALKDKKKTSEETNKMMKKTKEDLKRILNSLNKAERKATSENNKEKSHSEETENHLGNVTRAVSFIREIQSMFQVCRATCITASRQYYAQCRRFGNYYVQLANKGKYKGFQKESASYGFSSSLNLV